MKLNLKYIVAKMVYLYMYYCRIHESFLQMKIGEAFIEMLKGTEPKASLDVCSLICKSERTIKT